ncbi:MAG: hypothetical protein AAF657_41530 [Acidobacteriota bacterium]
MKKQQPKHLKEWVLLACLATGPAAAECPESIRAIDWERYLSQREVPNPQDCMMDPGPGNLAVELKSVDYGELNGEPGEEAVVRAQTCFFFSGGPDISEVLALHCSEDGRGWTLTEIPVDVVPYEHGPGKPRYAPKLFIDGSRLRSWVSLYRRTDPNVEPTWSREVTYTLVDGVFKIESIEIEGPEDGGETSVPSSAKQVSGATDLGSFTSDGEASIGTQGSV